MSTSTNRRTVPAPTELPAKRMLPLVETLILLHPHYQEQRENATTSVTDTPTRPAMTPPPAATRRVTRVRRRAPVYWQPFPCKCAERDRRQEEAYAPYGDTFSYTGADTMRQCYTQQDSWEKRS